MKRLPEHLRTKEGGHRLKRLRAFANSLRGFYGVPFYLVGSALLDVNAQPRDWDIRAALPEREFKRRYGCPDAWSRQGTTGIWHRERFRWSDDMVKQSKDGFRRTALNTDVQIYPEKHAAAYRYLPRLRLDTFRVRP